MPGTGLGPALLCVLARQGSCRILVIRHVIRQRWLAIRPREEEDSVEVEKSRAGGKDSLWVTTGLEQ